MSKKNILLIALFTFLISMSYLYKDKFHELFLSLSIPKKDPKITRVLAWGSNAHGQLGNGQKGQRLMLPVWATNVEKILQPNFKIIEIASNTIIACLLRDDKTVWCWGGGNHHEVSEPPPAVQKIDGLPPISKLLLNNTHTSCALDTDGARWCWFKSREGNSFSSAKLQGGEHDKFISWSASFDQNCYIDRNNHLFCAEGSDRYEFDLSASKYAQISVGEPIEEVSASNTQVCFQTKRKSLYCGKGLADDPIYEYFSPNAGIKGFTAGLAHNEKGCALSKIGQVICWESLGAKEHSPSRKNYDFSLLTGEGYSAPLSGMVEMSNNCAKNSDGEIWCWDMEYGTVDRKNKNNAFTIYAPSATCPIKYASILGKGASGYAAITAEKSYFDRLELPNRSNEVLALVQAGKFEKALNLYEQTSCLETNTTLAEEAMISAIYEQKIDWIEILIKEGIDLSFPYKKFSALSVAASSVSAEKEFSKEVLYKLISSYNSGNVVVDYKKRDNITQALKHLKKNENTADIEEHLKTLINTENHKPKLAKLPKSLNYNNPVCSKRFAGYTPSHPLYGIGNVEIGGLKTCLKDQKPIDSLNHDQMNISIYHSWSSKVKAEHQLYWNTIVSFMSKNKLPTEMLSLFYDVPNSYKKELISYKHINYISPPQVAKNMLFRARRIDNFNIFHDGWGEFEMANNRCQKMNRNWPVYAKINPDYRTNLGLNLKYKNTYFLVTGVEKDASARVAGLEIGDRIISINGHQVSTTGYRKLIEEIRGAVGDIVTITYTKENDSTNIMTAIGLELVVPNRRYKNDYAYNYYRTNETNNYQYKNFILFGPNVFPGDMKWKSSLELVNSKTGDTLKFKNIPCYNFIFYEDGDIEKFNIERQKRQKIKPEPRHTTKKPINKEKRKEQFENSIQFNTIKKDHSHYKIYQQMKESEKRLMRQ